MEKENRFRIIISIILIIVIILSICCYLIIKKDDNKDKTNNIKEIPKIKEEYVTTELNELSKYDSKIQVDNESKEIRLLSDEEGISYYIIGKIGAIFNNPIVINQEEDNSNTYGNYNILFDSEKEKYYYINSISKIISNLYDSIRPIYYKNKCNYLLLNNDNIDYLLNINTNETIETENNIVIDNINNEIFSDKYLIISNDDKYGIIDYNGNIIIEPSYDYISQYVSNDTFIVKKDKYYGIINYKNEIINKLEYDNIYYENSLNNYSIFIKNNKIGIFYNNKLIINFTIDYTNNDIYEYYIINNNLYLNISSSKDNNKLFLINEKGIQKFIDGKYNIILNHDDEISYFYTTNENDDDLNISIYDIDLYEYYKVSLNYKKQYDYIIYIDEINNSKNYQISITYDIGNNSEDQLYYIDLFNSKEISEIEALYTYFENGYAFTLNTNGVLNIYKNKELLNTYHNIDKYLGDYYFLNEKYNTKSDKTISTIYKLEFKKESN